jgi:glycosyltransferase involved in cell wall biosynthesis
MGLAIMRSSDIKYKEICMRIALDGVPLLTPKSGIGKYTAALADALRQLPQRPKLRLFYGIHWKTRLWRRNTLKSSVGYNDGINPDRYRWLPDPVRKYLKSTVSKMEFLLYRPHIFHGTNFTADSFGIPLVITVNDLSYLRYPEMHPPERIAWLTQQLPRSLNAADRIITISEFVKQEVITEFGISGDRVKAIPLGVGKEYHPRDPESLILPLKAYDLKPNGYILSVGTLEPRKNLVSLIRAYESLPNEIHKQWPLVLVGMRGWKDQGLRKTIETLQGKGTLKVLGYVPEDDLPYLYSGASIFVFPSLYEGFGLPPLEAMASGIPVIVSNRASLPEVVGDAGVYIDPLSEGAIAEAMRMLLGDLKKRDQLIQSGLHQAERCTWENCAEKTYNVYRSVLEENKTSK